LNRKNIESQCKRRPLARKLMMINNSKEVRNFTSINHSIY